MLWHGEKIEKDLDTLPKVIIIYAYNKISFKGNPGNITSLKTQWNAPQGGESLDVTKQMMMLCEKDTTSVQLQMFLQVQQDRVGKNYANGYSTTARLRQQIGWLRGSHDASKSSSAGNSRIMTAWSTWYGLRLIRKKCMSESEMHVGFSQLTTCQKGLIVLLCSCLWSSLHLFFLLVSS